MHNAVGPLTALGLTASFQNEGSAWEANWQEGQEQRYHVFLGRPNDFAFQAFFGYKYNRLQQIKQKYDPNGCMYFQT